MSFFSRKKPPTLTVVEELQQTYNDCCNLSIKNISSEENGEYEDALKGWKSLHTSLLYKIALFDKNLYKLSNDELTILVDLKSIRDENVRHLVRVQMLVDESNRKKLAEKHQATLLAAKQAQGQSAHSAPSPTPPSNSRNNSSMSVPSLRNGARPRAQVSSTPRSMLKSLRPPAINTKVNPNQAASAATSSWNKPVRKVAPRPSSPNLSQGHSQQGSSGPTSRAPRSTENLFDDFDQDTYKVNGSNGSVNGRSSLGRSSNSDSSSNLIDLSDHYEDDDDEDILHDYFSTDLDSPTLPSLPSLPLLPLAPTMPVESLAKMDLKSKSTTSIPKRREETKVAPKPKKPYVYVKPKPMDVNAVMKKTSENAKRNTTNASTVPVAKKNISYNYVKPPAPKAVRKKKESLPAQEKAADKVPEKVPSAAAPPEVSPEAPPDDHDLLIASIKGIDPIMAKQILNDIVVNGDEVYWEDIVGLDSAKNSLKEAVVYPFLRPDLFRGLREPTRGMLLFGPPGTGKTMLARAVATESKSTFFSISASSLTSKYLGESEKLVKALFLLAKKLAPSIVFIDEIDSMLSSRSDGEVESSRRIKNEFLVSWSELSSAAAGRDSGDDVSRVLILGATNLPWSIDEAARRRFVRRQYIPLPEGETRKNQIEKLLKYQNHTLSAQDFTDLIELTDGFSGSDLTALAKDSAMGPLRALGDDLLSTPTEDIRPINLDDFRSSLNYIRPSVSKEGLKEYENWATKFGSSGA